MWFRAHPMFSVRLALNIYARKLFAGWTFYGCPLCAWNLVRGEIRKLACGIFCAGWECMWNRFFFAGTDNVSCAGHTCFAMEQQTTSWHRARQTTLAERPVSRHCKFNGHRQSLFYRDKHKEAQDSASRCQGSEAIPSFNIDMRRLTIPHNRGTSL